MKPEQTRHNASIEDAPWWFAARRRIVTELVHDLVPPSKDTLVIDVGCGTGGNTGALAKEYRAIGVDAQPEAIAFASKRFPDAQFVCGPVPRVLGSLFGEASIVLMMDVLEHVEDDFEIFSAIAAETRPETYFLLTVPAEPRLWSKHDETSQHFRRYEVPRFEHVWQGLPFTKLMCSHYNARLYPLVKLVRSVNAKLGRTSGGADTDLVVPIAPVNRALSSMFGGEAAKLRRALAERRGSGAYDSGVSLIAVLRREAGEIRVRRKPSTLASDVFDPRERV
jgi:SAM-dependent methyltransferase